MTMIIKLYSRPNCSLCEDGLRTLKMVQEDIPFELEIINIEEDDELHEKYMLLIPVVEMDGVVIQHGILDYATLYEALSEE